MHTYRLRSQWSCRQTSFRSRYPQIDYTKLYSFSIGLEEKFRTTYFAR